MNRRSIRSLLMVSIGAGATLAGLSYAAEPEPPARPNRPPSSASGFTLDQANAGRVVYDANCSACHGAALSDGRARPIAGRDFRGRWIGRTVGALHDYIRKNMPPGQGGMLSDTQYAQLVALIMKENGVAPGAKPLPEDAAALRGMGLVFSDFGSAGSGGLAANIQLPPWPKPVKPVQKLTPVTDEMLKNPPPGDWLAWRRTLDGQGFSPLTQINPANVSRLRLAWTQTLSTGTNASTPLVHDGVIFVPSSNETMDALDAKTGDLQWTYSGGGRGVTRTFSLYEDKVYFTTSKGVVAIDAKTGKQVWESKLPARATSGAVVARGKVFQGLERAPGGSIQTLDARTGAPLWRWSTIAKSGEPGGDSWGDMPDDKRSGGSVWMPAYYDYGLDLLYVGVANTYDTAWLGTAPTKPGAHDALFTNTTVALKPDTGKIAWYYQHQAGDPFDFDWVFERTILSLPYKGQQRKSVVTMGKGAILDAVDAATGKYMFSIDAGLQNYLTGIDPVTGAKTINRALIPVKGDGKTRVVCPHYTGAKSWTPGAIDPVSKVAFYPLNESCEDLVPAFPDETVQLSSGFKPETRPIANSDGKVGRLQAFDLKTGKTLWTERQRAPLTSGVLGTAGGLVFVGGLDGSFSAHDQKTGKKLWTTRLANVPSSAPISYMVDGTQYIAVLVGYGTGTGTGFLPLVPEIPTPVRNTSVIYVFAVK